MRSTAPAPDAPAAPLVAVMARARASWRRLRRTLPLAALVLITGAAIAGWALGATGADASQDARRLRVALIAAVLLLLALAALLVRLARAVVERERDLRSDLRQLREVEQLQSDFVSTVSHELRTPLTSMRGALGLVLGGAAGAIDPRARDLLRIAHQNTDRLIRLINDILDIEKIEAGHVTLRREPVDLARILASTVAGVEALAGERGVRLELDAEPGVVLAGDADRLVQLFTNLLSNAIRYSPRGETVGIGAAVAGERVTVRVSDRGPGIPAEFQRRIFGRFQQAQGGASRQTGGTGLGLAISRAIVELHTGSIRFETAPGVGTTFIVELPCTPLATPAASVADTADDAAPARQRILLVDQDAGMLSVLRTLCAPLGEVHGATTVDDAWALARRTPFDAIVIDPGPPEAGGLALVRRLRALDDYSLTPVLVFSAREYREEELHGVALAPSHAFVKSRDSEQALALRLRATLAARQRAVPV